MRLTGSLVLATVTVTGCAAHHAASLADRFVHRGEPALRIGGDRPPAAKDDELATFIEKARSLQAQARPTPAGTSATMESADRPLAAALAAEAAGPSAVTHRAVGEAYRALGIPDLAFEHFMQATKADPNDAASYDQLARIWRDWGFPQLGLGDAYRAVYYAPESPSARNTLGTLLQAIGQPRAALDAYRRTLALAPDAPYALNNVCSALLAMRRPDQALAVCQRAVQLDPSLVAAQRNLAAAVALNRIDAGGPVADAGAPGTPGESLAPPAPQRAADAAPRDAADRAGVTERAKVYPTADVDRR